MAVCVVKCFLFGVISDKMASEIRIRDRYGFQNDQEEAK